MNFYTGIKRFFLDREQDVNDSATKTKRRIHMSKVAFMFLLSLSPLASAGESPFNISVVEHADVVCESTVGAGLAIDMKAKRVWQTHREVDGGLELSILSFDAYHRPTLFLVLAEVQFMGQGQQVAIIIDENPTGTFSAEMQTPTAEREADRLIEFTCHRE
jgi:hypothetical protein